MMPLGSVLGCGTWFSLIEEQLYYLREAAKPIYEADRHAKKMLKKRVRGIRPIERKLEGRMDPEAEVMRGYCSAVRRALTDDGRPPLVAAGLRGYPETFSHCRNEIKQPPCGHETQGDRMERACSV